MASEKRSKRSRSNPEEKRAQILGEATRIIGEYGYNGFTIQALANRCNLTNAGLLHYFGSKNKLLVALLEERDRRDTEALTSMVDDMGGRQSEDTYPLNLVFGIFLAIEQRNSTQPELVRMTVMLAAEATGEDHPAREYFLTKEAEALAIFTRMVAPHVPNPASTARQLIAMMHGLEIQWVRSNRGFDLVSEWEQALRVLLPGSRSLV